MSDIDLNQTSNIVAMLPWQQKLLLVTSNKGLFLYYNNHLRPFHVAEGLDTQQLSCAALSESTLALGTLQDGVILVDLKEHKTERVSTYNG